MSDGPATGVPPLLVIAGATATGKTGLAIRTALALREEGIPAEIISADSRQVYRGLDIGTAKAGPAEREGVPHHGLDLVNPDEPFSVGDFAAHVAGVLPGIASAGGLAILAGGTGFYLRAVARGIDLAALPFDRAVRREIETDLAELGLPTMSARLVGMAPTLASTVDLRNPRRVSRALEMAMLQGDRKRPGRLGYRGPSRWVGLEVPDATHRAWIKARARAQFEAGLVEEARALRERYDPSLAAFSAIGYAESWAVLDGEIDLETAIERDAARNVQFARRQRTWFRREPDIEWLDPSTSDPLPATMGVAHRLLDR